MAENKKRLNIAIPMELYIKVTEKSGITEAIIKGLELVLEPQKLEHDISQTNGSSTDFLKSRIKDLQEQLTDKDRQHEARTNDLQEHIKVNDVHQQKRIDDLKNQIQNLQDQLKIKDEQLRSKDNQIEKVNEIVKGQVANIFNLTNIKLLPSESKKRWWEIWKN
jgi:chromosome segregation ATPase